VFFVVLNQFPALKVYHLLFSKLKTDFAPLPALTVFFTVVPQNQTLRADKRREGI